VRLLTIAFWKSVWIWCKVNWKFMVGLAIPIASGMLIRKNKKARVLKSGLEFSKDQLLVEKEAAAIEIKGKDEAVKDFLSENSKIEEDHRASLEGIEDNRKEKIDSLSSAEKVTEEINNRLKS
jgi:hypothetical protein